MYFESNLNNFILIHLIFLLGKTDVRKFLKKWFNLIWKRKQV